MDRAEAFALQSLSDLEVLELLRASELPDSHQLHYWQMVAEKVGKAIRITANQSGGAAYSHASIVKALRLVRMHPNSADVLGFSSRASLHELIDVKCLPLASDIENLAPAIIKDGPNPEYPWSLSGSASWMAPCRHSFPVMKVLRGHYGAQLLHLLKRLLERREQLF